MFNGLDSDRFPKSDIYINIGGQLNIDNYKLPFQLNSIPKLN